MSDSDPFQPMLLPRKVDPNDAQAQRIFSLCIGLGRDTEPLLTALRVQDASRFAVDGLFVQLLVLGSSE